MVLLFSGQGTTIDNNFYFFPYDVKVDVQASVKASAISATELRSEIAKVRSRRILILFDACSNDCDLLRSELASGGITVLTASQGKETSLENEKWHHDRCAR